MIEIQEAVKGFTAIGVSPVLTTQPGNRIAALVTGTFVGTVVLESDEGGDKVWEQIATISAPECRVIEPGSLARHRFRCSAHASGIIVVQLYGLDQAFDLIRSRAVAPYPEIRLEKMHTVVVLVTSGANSDSDRVILPAGKVAGQRVIVWALADAAEQDNVRVIAGPGAVIQHLPPADFGVASVVQSVTLLGLAGRGGFVIFEWQPGLDNGHTWMIVGRGSDEYSTINV